MSRKRAKTRLTPRQRMVVVVAGSLVLHAVILGPAAMGALGTGIVSSDAEDPTIWPRTIDLVLVEPGSTRARSPDDGDTAAVVSATGGASDPQRQVRRPVPGGTVASGAPVGPLPLQAAGTRPLDSARDRDDISPEWRVAADALASGPRRIAPDCRRADLLPPVERELCARRLAQADTEAATARLGQRRLTRTESVREEGFAEQAAANEAWARYRRSEDTESYPGLRSMLKHF